MYLVPSISSSLQNQTYLGNRLKVTDCPLELGFEEIIKLLFLTIWIDISDFEIAVELYIPPVWLTEIWANVRNLAKFEEKRISTAFSSRIFAWRLKLMINIYLMSYWDFRSQVIAIGEAEF